MLSISCLKNFYYLPTFHDMRCKAPRISEIIRSRYHRDPHNGDVYIFMSKDQHKLSIFMKNKGPESGGIARQNIDVEPSGAAGSEACCPL